MASYQVTWQIDIEGADSALNACQRALAIQRNARSNALCFEVIDKATGEASAVDLLDELTSVSANQPPTPAATAADLEAVMQLIDDLLTWEHHMGGWESPVWERARALRRSLHARHSAPG